MNKISELKKEHLEITTFAEILKSGVKDLIPTKINDDFAEKFEKYFGNNRIPDYIVIYAGRIQAEKESIKCLGHVVDAILEGKFSEMRYDISKSEHLQKVFSTRPDLLSDWKAGESANLGEFLTKMGVTNAKANYNKFTIVDTDHYEDLFLAGTEVEGSCQKVDGEPFVTKGLIGNVIDGKNRLLAVKDQNGKIIARHVFRVLLDGEKPVLYMEIVYPSVKALDPHLKSALEGFAIQRSEKLGLSLLCSDETKPKYGNSISSLSTLDFVPFEYSDAGGHLTNGKFIIDTPHLLN